MMLVTICAQAQLKVYENGNVAIGTNDTPTNMLSVGFGGIPEFNINMTGENNGLYVRRLGTPTINDPWHRAIEGAADLINNQYNIGVRGSVTSPTEKKSGRAYGVWGHAGYATSGYNYGLFGRLLGTANGACIYTTTGNDTGINVGGRYAGYFNGDVKITGTLTANILSTSASSNNVTPVVSPLDNTEYASDAEKLSQLSMMQYYIETPVMTLSTNDTLEAMSLTPTEIQALQKKHYGFDAAELQEIYPDLVYENQQGELCINYIEMIPILAKSIKELKTEITTLQGGNNDGAAVMSRAAYGATDIDESTTITIPMLKQNNPNPFTENTVIEYSLPETVQTANLYIYDMNGKQIEQIALTERSESSITVNGGKLSAGMYLYSLIADGKVIDTKRMILTE